MSELIPLMMLAAGQMARVDQLLGLPEQVHRLEEIGLRLGAEIEMLQPGTPCIVRLAGHRLCFRGDESTQVLVRVEGAS